MSIFAEYQRTMLGLPYTPFSHPVNVLAPRSVNVQSARRHMSTDRISPPTDDTPYAQRRIKRAPLASSLELGAARRRQMLGKVNDQRQDAQYERRAEDMLRADFIKQQKQWQTELSQQAMDEDTEEEDVAQAEQQRIEQQEQEELEDLLQTYAELSQDDITEDHYSEHFGSDVGEELDYLMDKVYEEYSATLQSQDPGEAMDTS